MKIPVPSPITASQKATVVGSLCGPMPESPPSPAVRISMPATAGARDPMRSDSHPDGEADSAMRKGWAVRIRPACFGIDAQGFHQVERQ